MSRAATPAPLPVDAAGRPKRLYSIVEAAAYLGRSVGAVRELIWRGKLPQVRVDRRIHLDFYDLERFINENKTSFSP